MKQVRSAKERNRIFFWGGHPRVNVTRVSDRARPIPPQAPPLGADRYMLSARAGKPYSNNYLPSNANSNDDPAVIDVGMRPPAMANDASLLDGIRHHDDDDDDDDDDDKQQKEEPAVDVRYDDAACRPSPW